MRAVQLGFRVCIFIDIQLPSICSKSDKAVQVSGRTSPRSSHRTPYGSAVSRAAPGGPRQLVYAPPQHNLHTLTSIWETFMEQVDVQGRGGICSDCMSCMQLWIQR